MTRIQILVGSEMGTAEMVAASAKDYLEGAGFDAVVNPLPEISDITDHPDDLLLVCTSNTGAGDLPGNIQPLYLSLVREFPAIAGRRYGVINLGDSSYTTFGEAGRAIDHALSELGAERVGEPLVLDACSGEDPEQEALDWLPQWVAQL
ncbi:flavodoxin domain-containing protein [Gilvimarinus xylanilyticus]|uniref:Flavodoxin domain-containing protein n=1 Tax=Gilvimarinus xylanilyticus TaxID=2944139 RepID=A0A9X2HZ58_9GAMM|nr:flavodoxin domain-containing protein [Gilvimarinus xylanilyticus]MCP8899176.1 flavodoxin domain-containing protein [Gilvimarinus xylanilyticus]